MPITFSAITYSNDTGYCKQMGYIFWGLEVIWFLHNCFIKIGHIKTYSKLEISLPIIAPYQYKSVDSRSCLVYRLQTPSCIILLVSFLKTSFKCTGIEYGMGDQKTSNNIKNIRIIGKNLFIACNELENYTFVVRHFRLLL